MQHPLADVFKLEPGEFLIEKPQGADGPIICRRMGINVTVEQGDLKRRVFHRNAIKNPGGRHVRWLVVEHGLTHIYFTEDGIVITDRDRNP